MEPLLPVYIEIEKDSNIKYEYDKATSSLVIDRMLPDTHTYPYAYGFFPNTLAADGDELDILIINNTHDIKKDTTYQVYIIGALVMEDEKGMDEKILCVLADDYSLVRDITQISDETKDKIDTFFSTYKINVPGKWSKTYGFLNKERAIELYRQSVVV